MDPPSYASSSTPSTALAESDEAPFLVNLVPTAPGPPTSSSAAVVGGGRSDGVSFQHGHLGAGPSSLQGEVQIKLLASADLAPPITQIEIVFRGVERSFSRGRRRSHLSDRVSSEDPQLHSPTTEIELVETKKTLWERPASTSPGPRQPPGVIPFKIDLTPDLPHCVHPGRGRGGLEYELEAKVHCGAAVASTGIRGTPTCVGVKAPVHLLRYSKRGEPLAPPPSFGDEEPSAPALGRAHMSAHSPTPVSVIMSKTLLRRGEPLGLKVRIPPPAQELVEDKGLKLRSVSAELRRHIRARRLDQSTTDEEADDEDETSTAVEQDAMPVDAPPYAHDTDRDLGSGSDSLPASDDKDQPDPSTSSSDDAVVEHTTVLAFSGKSCRFSSSRPVVLHLALYPSHSTPAPSAYAAAAVVAGASHSPPSAHTHSMSGGEAPMRRDHRLATASSTDCESITQATILHDVGFSVVVTVQIVGRNGERHDLVLESAVGIVPDFAPLPEKAREAEDDAAVTGQDGRVGFAGPRSVATGEPDAMDTEGDLDSAPAPLYAEMHLEDAARAASTSSSSHMPTLWEGTSRTPFGAAPDEQDDDDGEDEYDGYEDFSALAGTSGPAPPTIDEDEPPPPAPDAPPEGMDLGQPNSTVFRQPDDVSEGEDSDSDGDSSADSSPVLTATGSDQGFAFVPLDRFGSSGGARRSITPPPPASPPPLLEDQPGRASLVSPPAYAGWSTSAVDADASRADAGPPPPISPLDHTDLSRESNRARRVSSPTATGQAHHHHHHHHRHGAQAAPPPPYAAEFGVLPPGMIGVARPDNGEIGGFLVRR